MEEDTGDAKSLWIFGYGSLCWYPGFEYKKSMVGFIRGFERRFWQGNTTHRGTTEKPGRVATLVEEEKGIVYGRAFQVHDSAAIPYLQNRECTLGGYITTFSNFLTRDGRKSFPVLVYIATKKNQHWLGEASLQAIAKQITECSGPSGHNAEYLLRLADFMRRYVPEADDEHLFTLDLLVRSAIKERNLCLITLMGKKEYHIDIEESSDEQIDDNTTRNRIRENSFQYAAKIPAKTMRCLKP